MARSEGRSSLSASALQRRVGFSCWDMIAGSLDLLLVFTNTALRRCDGMIRDVSTYVCI